MVGTRICINIFSTEFDKNRRRTIVPIAFIILPRVAVAPITPIVSPSVLAIDFVVFRSDRAYGFSASVWSLLRSSTVFMKL